MTTNRTDADMTADEIAEESQSAVDPARELLERIQKSREEQPTRPEHHVYGTDGSCRRDRGRVCVEEELE